MTTLDIVPVNKTKCWGTCIAGTLKHDSFINCKSTNYIERYYNTLKQTLCFITRCKADIKETKWQNVFTPFSFYVDVLNTFNSLAVCRRTPERLFTVSG